MTVTKLYRVTAPVVKVAIGSLTGNRVARILTRGALVPEGVDQALLDNLSARGLIESVEVNEVVEPEQTDLTAPPKDGSGSGKAAWHTYAAAIGVEVPADASRDDVIAAIEAAGKPTE